MFNRRLLTGLGIVTAVALGLAVWLNRPVTMQQSDEAVAFVPALKEKQEAVTTLSLDSKTAKLNLAKQDNQWRVQERDGYPANNGKVREVLTALTDAKIAEAKTADPTRYNKLGVEDNSDKSFVLSVKAGEEAVTSFVVGTGVYRPAGNYVRRVGEAQSYLIDRELKIGREVRDWIDADIINLPATKIVKIERLIVPPAIQCVRAPCEAPAFYLNKKEGSAEFAFDNLPADREMQASHIISGLTDALNGLTANDVQKSEKLSREGAKQTVTRFFSDDQQIITLTHLAFGDKHFVELDVKAGDEASAETKAAVEKLAKKVHGWVYEISSYKGEGLARGFDELTQKKEAKK